MGLRALVRRPSPHLGNGLLSHLERTPVDVPLAWHQWQKYAHALKTNGWIPIEVPKAKECPDSAFVEDTMVVMHDLAVIARSGAAPRRLELHGAEATIRALGYRIAHIVEPGTLDGGDVLKVGSQVYVGRSERTNDAGIEQLREHVAPFDAKVTAVPVTKVLHLKSAVTALPDGTVVGYPPLVDDVEAFTRFQPVDEEAGSHVVLLGGQRLLMAASAPRTAEQFSGLGYEPVLVDISEFEKLEGCVTCLSVRLRGWAPSSAS
jgi:dimethylargininase